MDKKLVLFALLLIVAVSVRAQDYDCYSSTRAQGIQQMQLKQYARAIEFFNAAEDCPDKPADNDLRAKREECIREINKATEAIEKKGYMEITSVSFANVNSSGSEISGYGSTIYGSDLRYLKPRVNYNGLATENKSIELFFKLFDPNGTLKTNSSSPRGYTWRETQTVYPGNSKTMRLSSWGVNSSGSSAVAIGSYKFEIWYKDNRIYSTTVSIKKKPSEATFLNVNDKTSISKSFPASGGYETFYVSTDAESWTTWGVPSWCSIENVTSNSFRLRCSENTSSSAKNDYLKIVAGGKEVRIDVSQSGKPYQSTQSSSSSGSSTYGSSYRGSSYYDDEKFLQIGIDASLDFFPAETERRNSVYGSYDEVVDQPMCFGLGVRARLGTNENLLNLIGGVRYVMGSYSGFHFPLLLNVNFLEVFYAGTGYEFSSSEYYGGCGVLQMGICGYNMDLQLYFKPKYEVVGLGFTYYF